MSNIYSDGKTKDRIDPYMAFNFTLQIDQIIVGGFNDISGIDLEIELERKREGGVNDLEYKFPKFSKRSDLTLKRGVVDVDQVWKWYQQIVEGQIIKKNCTIYLFERHEKKQRARVWNIMGAYPIKWQGPTLGAKTSDIATETFVLTYDRLDVQEIKSDS